MINFPELYRPPVVKNEDIEKLSLFKINWKFACFVQFFDDMLPNN